jgi:hypothetical protein
MALSGKPRWRRAAVPSQCGLAAAAVTYLARDCVFHRGSWMKRVKTYAALPRPEEPVDRYCNHAAASGCWRSRHARAWQLLMLSCLVNHLGDLFV